MRWLLSVQLLIMTCAALRGQEKAAQIERIAAMERIVDLALIPPTLNTSPLPEYDYDRSTMVWRSGSSALRGSTVDMLGCRRG